MSGSCKKTKFYGDGLKAVIDGILCFLHKYGEKIDSYRTLRYSTKSILEIMIAMSPLRLCSHFLLTHSQGDSK